MAAGGASPALAHQLELRLRQAYDGNVYEVRGSSNEHVRAYYSRLAVTYESPSSPDGF